MVLGLVEEDFLEVLVDFRTPGLDSLISGFCL